MKVYIAVCVIVTPATSMVESKTDISMLGCYLTLERAQEMVRDNAGRYYNSSPTVYGVDMIKSEEDTSEFGCWRLRVVGFDHFGNPTRELAKYAIVPSVLHASPLQLLAGQAE